MKMIGALTIAIAVTLFTMAAAIALAEFTVINGFKISASVPSLDALPEGRIVLAGGDEVNNG